jgi:ribosomal protein S12 methylthiotransferase accessory factor YcaO
MQSTQLVRHILRDEAVTRGLGDVEARMIVEWLADRTEQVAQAAATEAAAWDQVRDLCRRARVIACFVRLWAVPGSRGAAVQLAAAERTNWPLPTGDTDPGELMEGILAWTDRQDEIVADSLARRAA